MTALPAFGAGSDPTAGQIQALLPIFAFKSSDNTVNNTTTFKADTDLIWALGGADGVGTYWIDLNIIYNSNSTANWKMALLLPTSTIQTSLTFLGLKLGGAATVDTLPQASYTSGTAVALAGNGADAAVRVKGLIQLGGVPGNLQVEFSQNTANASNTVLRSGSGGACRQVK